MLHLSAGSQCRLRPSQQRTLLYILSVLPEKSLMRNLCVRDRMATDAPLVATAKGTEGEAIAEGLGNAVVAAMPTSAAVCACRMMMPDHFLIPTMTQGAPLAATYVFILLVVAAGRSTSYVGVPM